MDANTEFRFGEWLVRPQLGRIERANETIRLKPKSMAVLNRLAAAGGAVVTRKELLDAVWPNMSITDDVLTQNIRELRKAFGDSARGPQYIETIPKVGFRLLPPILPQPSVSLGEINSLAVLPIVNIGSDPEHEYFADGITEEILNTLAAIDGLRVVGRTSSFAFKGRNQDLRIIGNELGVDAVLEGSVRINGTQLRLAAQLVSTADGFHLWSECYDQELGDVFEIQQAIASSISAALKLKIGLRVEKSVKRRSTANLVAYSSYLKARSIYHRADHNRYNEALHLLDRAIDLDPNFRPIYPTYAAICLQPDTDEQIPLLPQHTAKLEALYRRGRTIDRECAEMRTTESLIYHHVHHDLVRSRQTLEGALAQDPDNSDAKQYYAVQLSMLWDEPARALEYAQSLLDREPLSIVPRVVLGRALRSLGRLEEAELEFSTAINLEPNRTPAYREMGWLHMVYWKDYVKAYPYFKKHVELLPTDPLFAYMMTLMFLDLGDDAKAHYWATAAHSNAPDNFFSDLATYTVHYFRGEWEDVNSLGRRLASCDKITRFWMGIRHFLWLRHLQRAEPALALSVYRRLYPELFDKDVQIFPFNHAAAISLAELWFLQKDEIKANALLDKVLSFLTGRTVNEYAPALTTIYVMQNEIRMSLDAFQEEVKKDFVCGRWLLEREPIYEPLRDRDEFKGVMQDTKTSLSNQRAEMSR